MGRGGRDDAPVTTPVIIPSQYSGDQPCSVILSDYGSGVKITQSLSAIA